MSLVFYHFQAMKYLKDGTIDIGVNMYPGYVDSKLCKVLYESYISLLEEKRDWLKDNYLLDLSNRYSTKFCKKEYFFGDILGERTPFVFFRKLWRMIVRKKRDYFLLVDKTHR